VLPSVGADIDQCTLVGVGGVHNIAESIEDELFVSAIVKNIVVHEIAEIALVSNIVNVNDEIDAPAAVARDNRSRLFETEVGAAKKVAVGEKK
jgi:hypothetical protein